MNVYIAGKITGGNPHRDALIAVANFFNDEGDYIMTDFVMDIKINDQRWPDLSVEERNNTITQDDKERIKNSRLLVMFVTSNSYGSGFEESYTAAKKEDGILKIDILKLIHEDDWSSEMSKIAGNSLHGDLKIYRTPEEAIEFAREFREKIRNPEGNVKNKERE